MNGPAGWWTSCCGSWPRVNRGAKSITDEAGPGTVPAWPAPSSAAAWLLYTGPPAGAIPMPRPDHRAVPAWRIDAGQRTRVRERVAEEVAVALVYNGTPHVVMMASPGDLADFALGFSITEDLVASADEFELVEVLERDAGLVVQCLVPESRHAALRERARNLPGRSGCGLCGAQSLDGAIRPIRRVRSHLRVDAATVSAALAALAQQQSLNRATGAVHAAALVDESGLLVREDIGRHNALDKLVGAMLGKGRGPGFVLITSRASYEIVHKAAAAGVELVAAISAPSALAIRLAEEAGITLVGFARDTRMTAYSHPRRLI